MFTVSNGKYYLPPTILASHTFNDLRAIYSDHFLVMLFFLSKSGCDIPLDILPLIPSHHLQWLDTSRFADEQIHQLILPRLTHMADHYAHHYSFLKEHDENTLLALCAIRPSLVTLLKPSRDIAFLQTLLTGKLHQWKLDLFIQSVPFALNSPFPTRSVTINGISHMIPYSATIGQLKAFFGVGDFLSGGFIADTISDRLLTNDGVSYLPFDKLVVPYDALLALNTETAYKVLLLFPLPTEIPSQPLDNLPPLGMLYYSLCGNYDFVHLLPNSIKTSKQNVDKLSVELKIELVLDKNDPCPWIMDSERSSQFWSDAGIIDIAIKTEKKPYLVRCIAAVASQKIFHDGLLFHIIAKCDADLLKFYFDTAQKPLDPGRYHFGLCRRSPSEAFVEAMFYYASDPGKLIVSYITQTLVVLPPIPNRYVQIATEIKGLKIQIMPSLSKSLATKRRYAPIQEDVYFAMGRMPASYNACRLLVPDVSFPIHIKYDALPFIKVDDSNWPIKRSEFVCALYDDDAVVIQVNGTLYHCTSSKVVEIETLDCLQDNLIAFIKTVQPIQISGSNIADKIKYANNATMLTSIIEHRQYEFVANQLIKCHLSTKEFCETYFMELYHLNSAGFGDYLFDQFLQHNAMFATLFRVFGYINDFQHRLVNSLMICDVSPAIEMLHHIQNTLPTVLAPLFETDITFSDQINNYISRHPDADFTEYLRCFAADDCPLVLNENTTLVLLQGSTVPYLIARFSPQNIRFRNFVAMLMTNRQKSENLQLFLIWFGYLRAMPHGIRRIANSMYSRLLLDCILHYEYVGADDWPVNNVLQLFHDAKRRNIPDIFRACNLEAALCNRKDEFLILLSYILNNQLQMRACYYGIRCAFTGMIENVLNSDLTPNCIRNPRSRIHPQIITEIKRHIEAWQRPELTRRYDIAGKRHRYGEYDSDKQYIGKPNTDATTPNVPPFYNTHGSGYSRI